MKIAAVYTSTTPELIAMVNQQLQDQFAGQDMEILSYQDPSILQEARDNGGLTAGCARRLLSIYEQGVQDGADVLFNICSSVGDAAVLAKPLYELAGTPFVRIDEDMAMAAVAAHQRIGVIATLKTTMEPTKRLIQQCAARQGKTVQLEEALVNAFGADQNTFKQKLVEAGLSLKGKVDALLFAQGSMAYAEEAVSAAVGLPVYSSIRFGTRAVKEAADKLAAK